MAVSPYSRQDVNDERFTSRNTQVKRDSCPPDFVLNDRRLGIEVFLVGQVVWDQRGPRVPIRPSGAARGAGSSGCASNAIDCQLHAIPTLCWVKLKVYICWVSIALSVVCSWE